MMLSIPDVLNAEQLQQCRAALEGGNWQDGRLTACLLYTSRCV